MYFMFNGGGALAASSDAAMAMPVTHISAAVGAMTWVFYEWKKVSKPTKMGTVTGMVAGLGTITPASGQRNKVFYFKFKSNQCIGVQ
jgi:Amt family ammonium transporter